MPNMGVPPFDPSVFFPASPDDVRAIILRLPVGVADGISSIQFEAGTAYVNDHAPSTDTFDPVIGRRGEEVYPGVYSPSIRGSYDTLSNEIRLFGYVRAPSATLLPWQAQELRFAMLRTLVHEVAHHYDRITRVGRGRWRMDSTVKSERYADDMAIRWCLDVVVPYLVELYGQLPGDAV